MWKMKKRRRKALKTSLQISEGDQILSALNKTWMMNMTLTYQSTNILYLVDIKLIFCSSNIGLSRYDGLESDDEDASHAKKRSRKQKEHADYQKVSRVFESKF